MQRRSVVVAAAAALVTCGFLTGCTEKTSEATLRAAVTAGPHADIVTKAAEVAKARGLKVEVVEFTDYVTPDKALADKGVDVAVYQHEPFMNNFNRQQGTHLVKVADAVVQPMGFYSKSIRALDAIPTGATVSIPNDPTNGARGLLLLAKAGLIELAPGHENPTVADVTKNPRQLKIVEMEAAQLPRSLDDMAVAVIPMNYVISSGLTPAKDGFYFEDLKAPFALIIIASREDNREAANVKAFVEAYRSPEVKAFIQEKFKGTVNPTW